jgi:FKBP-type peptidyl-prolyl cis-trans isomerase
MYTLGVNLARQLGDVRPLVQSGEELASVAKGLLDTVIGRLSEDGQRQMLAQRGQDLNTLITGRANELRVRLEQTGREMLQEMADRHDTDVLDSGVVLHVTQPGPQGWDRGIRPTRSSTIKVHYHGTLPDGTVFDSTLDGEPVTFPLANVIPGWCEGIMHMHQGETAMLGIPPEQAYGAEGTPDGRVPGGSTLFFKVDLLEVLSAGIEDGGSGLVDAQGQTLQYQENQDPGLLGPDGRPMY